MSWTYITPILLLCCSNVFMTFAWVRSGPTSRSRRWTQSASGALRATNAPSLSEAPGDADSIHPISFARVA